MALAMSPVPAELLVHSLAGMRVFLNAPRNYGEFKKVKRKLKSEMGRVLTELGQAHGLETRYEGHRHEYLFDAVWMNHERAMILAAESEAGIYVPEVLYDFEKLFYAKAPMKLLLFSDSPMIQREHLIQRIEDDLRGFKGHIAGEEYIIVQFCNFETRKMQAYRYAINGSGANGSTRFVKFFEHEWPSRELRKPSVQNVIRSARLERSYRRKPSMQSLSQHIQDLRCRREKLLAKVGV